MPSGWCVGSIDGVGKWTTTAVCGGTVYSFAHGSKHNHKARCSVRMVNFVVMRLMLQPSARMRSTLLALFPRGAEQREGEVVEQAGAPGRDAGRVAAVH